MEGLTKENFWNHARESYPEAVDEFCKWIDEYKKSAQWEKLFLPDIKFHHIPFEMQQGIMLRWCQEKMYNEDHAEQQEKEFLMMFVGFLSDPESTAPFPGPERKCRVCGCTDDDCTQCVKKTGQPCHWVEEDLCSACQSSIVQPNQGKVILLPGRDF